MTVLLVYGAYTSNAARQILTSLTEPVIVFEVDDHVPTELATSNVRVRTYESYLSEADYENIDRFVLDFMQRGFHVDGEDLTEWQGVSLGPALAVQELLMPTITTIKNALCARRVFEQVKPTRICLGDGLGLPRDVWREEAERSGIPCVILESDLPVQVDPQWMARMRPGVSQRRLWALVRRTVKGAYLIPKTITWLGRQVIEWVYGSSKRPCVLLLESESTELALRLKKSSQVRAKYVSECAPPLLQYLARWLVERKARPIFARRWLRLRTSGPTAPVFQYQGIDLWPHLSSWVESVFKDTLPAYAGAMAIAQQNLNWENPALLFLERQYSPYALLARACGILVVSRQYEWTAGSRTRYLPPALADHLLCWGEFSARYFERQGFPGEQLLKVGCADFDNLKGITPVDVCKIHEELNLDINSKVVLFTDQYFQPFEASPSPLDYVATHLDAIILAARELSDIHFIIKFHPKTGKDKWHERPDGVQRRVNRLQSAMLSNLRLAPLRSDLAGLLAIADVVVTYWSTTAIQAMVLEKPVLLLNLTGKASYWPDLDTPEAPFGVTNVEELVSTLHGLLAEEDVREEALARQCRYLERILAPEKDQADSIELLASEQSSLKKAAG